MSTLGERVRERREEKKMSQGALAAAVGTTQPTIWSLEAGEQSSTKFIHKIARTLQTTVEWLETGNEGLKERLEGDQSAVIAVPISGIAETEAFRAGGIMEKLRINHAASVHVAADRDYPGVNRFALVMRGPGMDQAHPPILDGNRVVFVAMDDLPVENSKIYAVRRSRDGGASFEVSIRRAKVFRSHTELHAESSAEFPHITIPPAEGEIVEVFGLARSLSVDL